jgi:hypothetical protein
VNDDVLTQINALRHAEPAAIVLWIDESAYRPPTNEVAGTKTR